MWMNRCLVIDVLKVVEIFVLTHTQAPLGRIVGSQKLSPKLDQQTENLIITMIMKTLKNVCVFLTLFRGLHCRPVKFIILDIVFCRQTVVLDRFTQLQKPTKLRFNQQKTYKHMNVCEKMGKFIGELENYGEISGSVVVVS